MRAEHLFSTPQKCISFLANSRIPCIFLLSLEYCMRNCANIYILERAVIALETQHPGHRSPIIYSRASVLNSTQDQ